MNDSREIVLALARAGYRTRTMTDGDDAETVRVGLDDSTDRYALLSYHDDCYRVDTFESDRHTSAGAASTASGIVSLMESSRD